MIRLFHQYFSVVAFIFVLGEGLLIYGAVFLAALITFDTDLELLFLQPIIWLKILLITLATQMSLFFNDLYEKKIAENYIDLSTRLIQSVGITSILLAIIYFLFPSVMIARWVFFMSIVIILLVLVSWRLLYFLFAKSRFFSEKVIILGSNGLAQDIVQQITARSDLNYIVSSLIVQNNGQKPSSIFQGIPIHTGFDVIPEIADAEHVTDIIIGLDEMRGILPVNELLRCKVGGINIIDGKSFYEMITGKLMVEKINPSWLIFSDGFIKSKTTRVIKRLAGFAAASFGLVLLFPLMALVAVAIKLDSPGPILFGQERLGEYEKPFTLYKFRSMKADAEEGSGPVWTSDDDPRITRVGGMIRKLRIDELPQMWNVLRGNMSFVGPRPERQFFVQKLKKKIPYYNERFSVKPGITGYAQVLYPYGASEKDALEKLKYDLYYIKNMSLVLDVIVIFKTLKIVLLGRGAR
jgi:sugar transferase (PEP-CTERM system associated)